MTTLHAARGEVYNQRSGPRKPCRGWSGWVVQLGRTRDSGPGEVYPGYGTNDQGPTHGKQCPNSAKQCPNVPSFLIDQYIDEVSDEVS